MLNSIIFQQNKLFAKISDRSLQQLMQVAKYGNYQKNNVILTYQESSDNFLYLMTGWLKLFKQSGNGEEIVDILTNHHYCGEQFILPADALEGYIVQAISNVELFTIPIRWLRYCIKHDIQLSANFLQASFKKQQHLTMEIEHLSIQNAMQRIGCFLLRLRRFKRQDSLPHAITLSLPCDKALLASRLGMRAETFSRALSKLCRQCDITTHGDILCINDITSITHYVCQHCSKKFPCNETID